MKLSAAWTIPIRGWPQLTKLAAEQWWQVRVTADTPRCLNGLLKNGCHDRSSASAAHKIPADQRSMLRDSEWLTE